MSLLGVALASIGSGFGESCYLALAAHYPKFLFLLLVYKISLFTIKKSKSYVCKGLLRFKYRKK